MAVVTTRLTVAPDGTVSTAIPLPAGSYAVIIELHDRAAPWRGRPLHLHGPPRHQHAQRRPA